VKHNTVSHAIDTHGAEYPPRRKPVCHPCYDPDPDNPGTEGAIVRDNVIDNPDCSGSAITLRGGKGLVQHHTIRGYSKAIQLSKQTPQVIEPIPIWDDDIIDPMQWITGAGKRIPAIASLRLGLRGFRHGFRQARKRTRHVRGLGHRRPLWLAPTLLPAALVIVGPGHDMLTPSQRA